MGKNRNARFLAPVKRHELKVVEPHFTQLTLGLKTFEFRKNDRDFQVLDEILCLEFVPGSNTYTGRSILFTITHLLTSEDLSPFTFSDPFPDGFVILSLRFTDRYLLNS